MLDPEFVRYERTRRGVVVLRTHQTTSHAGVKC